VSVLLDEKLFPRIYSHPKKYNTLDLKNTNIFLGNLEHFIFSVFLIFISVKAFYKHCEFQNCLNSVHFKVVFLNERGDETFTNFHE
jgi:hypothetical protein